MMMMMMMSRVRYNQSNYREVYKDKEDELNKLEESEEQPSLCDLIQRLEQPTALSERNQTV